MREQARQLGIKSASAQGLQGCSVCTLVAPFDATVCDSCGARLHPGWGDSIQETWAWLITSVILYIPANFLPIMYTTFLGKTTESTILGGVVILWQHGSYPIALVIFVASVLVPIGKIFVLGWLCISAQIGSTLGLRQKARRYRITEFVGRWSMVDVFVVGILVALIQLGNIMTILPGAAALAFAAMVATTMFAAIAFDPRLVWRPFASERMP